MSINTQVAPKIRLVDQKVITTSRDIAELFEKRHDDVLKKIRCLDCSREFGARNFTESNYKDVQQKDRAEFQVTRDGFSFLAMSFTGKKAARFKEAYIEAFNHVEQSLKSTQQIEVFASRYIVWMNGNKAQKLEPISEKSVVLEVSDIPGVIRNSAQMNQKLLCEIAIACNEVMLTKRDKPFAKSHVPQIKEVFINSGQAIFGTDKGQLDASSLTPDVIRNSDPERILSAIHILCLSLGSLSPCSGIPDR